MHQADRPQFLKIAYNGPKALEELASFDPSLIVGVLGGGAGTTRDCFELLHQAEKLRRPRRAVRPQDQPRRVAAGDRRHDAAGGRRQRRPHEAVRAYHGELQREGIRPLRDLDDDNRVTEAVLRQG